MAMTMRSRQLWHTSFVRQAMRSHEGEEEAHRSQGARRTPTDSACRVDEADGVGCGEDGATESVLDVHFTAWSGLQGKAMEAGFAHAAEELSCGATDGGSWGTPKARRPQGNWLSSLTASVTSLCSFTMRSEHVRCCSFT